MLSYSTVCPTRHWISFNFPSPVPGIKSNFFWGYGLGNLIYRILVSGDFSGGGGGRGGGGYYLGWFCLSGLFPRDILS